MLATEIQSRLVELKHELALAESEGLWRVPAYMADLDREIA